MAPAAPFTIAPRILVIVSLLAYCACGRSPAPPAPSAPDQAVIFVLINGVPNEPIVVGEERQLSAAVQFTDRHFKTGATTQVAWLSSNPSVLTVSPSGVMRTVGPGEAVITATFQAITGRAPVTVWPRGPLGFRGVVRSSNGAPVQGARVQVGALETTSDAGGRFTITTTPPNDAGAALAFALHDDYEVASVQVGPQHVATGIDLTLIPSPDRVYLRVRGHDSCVQFPIGGRHMATFPVQHSGRWELLRAGLNASAFVGCCGAALTREAPDGGTPIVYRDHQPLDGGYVYTWLIGFDYEVCGREFDMTLAHPR